MGEVIYFVVSKEELLSGLISSMTVTVTVTCFPLTMAIDDSIEIYADYATPGLMSATITYFNMYSRDA